MEKKGRILILTNSIGGIYCFRKEVVKAINDIGYEVIISKPDDDSRGGYFEEIGCHVFKTEFDRRGMNPLADFNLMIRYRKMIKQLKPKAVLTYTIKPNVYGGIACRLLGIPLIANVTGLGDAVENGGWLQKLTVFLYKLGIGKARQVFFQNTPNRERFIQYGIADDHSVVLPGSGVNLVYHSYQEYPMKDDIVRFLFIGRLLKDKGIEEFFQAAEYIKTKHPNTEFRILGRVDGPYQSRLDELVKKGVINHLGVTTDVRPFVGDVHCTIMPSYHEGMSNVNLESSANGRPVITTNVPGCRETVDNGRTGFLVEAKNTQSLIDGIERFLSLPLEQKKRMGIDARKKVEIEFDRNIVIKAYLDAIDLKKNN